MNKYFENDNYSIINLLTYRALQNFHPFKDIHNQLFFDKLIKVVSITNGSDYPKDFISRYIDDISSEKNRPFFKLPKIIDSAYKPLDLLEFITPDKPYFFNLINNTTTLKDLKALFWGKRTSDSGSETKRKRRNRLDPEPQRSHQMVSKEDFPQSLDELVYVKNLGGGTNSTHLLQNAKGQLFVAKTGCGLEQLQIEILMNLLCACLEVPVPHVQGYTTLPQHLTAAFGLQKTPDLIQLAAYIPPALQQDITHIQRQVADHFAALAFLGNIDMKHDNFIHAVNGRVYVIDSGANPFYRSLGAPREENPDVVSELESLRNPHKNTIAAEWFSHLSPEMLREQVKHVLGKRNQLEAALWQATPALDFTSTLQTTVIDTFSTRLDYLATCYGFKSKAGEQQATADRTADDKP